MENPAKTDFATARRLAGLLKREERQRFSRNRAAVVAPWLAFAATLLICCLLALPVVGLIQHARQMAMIVVTLGIICAALGLCRRGVRSLAEITARHLNTMSDLEIALSHANRETLSKLALKHVRSRHGRVTQSRGVSPRSLHIMAKPTATMGSKALKLAVAGSKGIFISLLLNAQLTIVLAVVISAVSTALLLLGII